MPAGWKLRSHAGSRLQPISHPWLKNVSCCRLAWHNFQKCVNSDPFKERKPCVKWLNDNTFLVISDFWSEKDWKRVHVYTRPKTSEDFGRLRMSSEDFGLLQETLDFFGLLGNDCVVFKNPSTPRIKISCLQLCISEKFGWYTIVQRRHIFHGRLVRQTFANLDFVTPPLLFYCIYCLWRFLLGSKLLGYQRLRFLRLKFSKNDCGKS